MRPGQRAIPDKGFKPVWRHEKLPREFPAICLASLRVHGRNR